MNTPALSPNAKVGITTVVIVVVMMLVGRWLGWEWTKFGEPKGYPLYILFPNIRGLSNGSTVTLNGGWVGEVSENWPMPDGSWRVTVLIKDDKIAIHQGANAIITAESPIANSKTIAIEEPLGAERDRESSDSAPEYLLGLDLIEEGDPVVQVSYGQRTILGEVIAVAPERNDKVRVRLEMLPGQSIPPTHLVVPAFFPDDRDRTLFEVHPALGEGDRLIGSKEPEITDIVVQVNDLLETVEGILIDVEPQIEGLVTQMDAVLANVADILDEDHISELMRLLEGEITRTSNSLNLIAGDIRTLLTDTTPQLKAILANVEGITEETETALTEVNSLLEDPETRESLEHMLAELESASAELNLLLKDVRQLSADPEFQGDVKASVKAARSTLEKADAALGDVQASAKDFFGFRLDGSFRTRYQPETQDTFSDVRLELSSEDAGMFYLGASDIGEDTALDAGLGRYMSENFAVRGGIRKGQIGLGASTIWDLVRIDADYYDFNDPHFDVFGTLAVTEEWAVLLGLEDAFDEEGNLASFGVQMNF